MNETSSVNIAGKKHDLKENKLKACIISDLHCGHRSGLSPPEYQSGGRKYVNRQNQKWEWYKQEVQKHGPYDVCIALGDLCDGLGVKNHSETIIGDLNRQILCAVECVKTVPAKRYIFLYGTMVHTATKDGLELELEVAQLVNSEKSPDIHSQVWLQFGNYVLDCRHAPAGKSMVPHTRANPIQRERVSNEQWFLNGEEQPKADIYLRGHLHYCFRAGIPGKWEGFNVPALQSPDTKYGRILSNVVHTGFCTLETIDGEWPIFRMYEAPKWPKKIYKL